MLIKDLEKIASPVYADYNGETSIKAGYTSDLLSDVIGFCPDEAVLITVQCHKNTVAVASLAGIEAVIFCSKRKPDAETVLAAQEEEIALFTTKNNQFEVSNAVGALLEGK